jgi:Zn-dependent protease/CBS domain-containing protein
VTDSSGLGAPADRNSSGALRVGSIGGIDVMVRSSWLLVAALLSYVVATRIEAEVPGLGGWRYLAGLACAILLTLSLLLHEVSHALVARRCGIPVRSITLHFIGGVTAIDGEPRTPRQELAISGVGPLTSIGIGLAALGLYLVTPGALLQLVVGMLAAANLLVGVLNLVPGMPLDGGRVLRAAVWKVTGDPHKATAVSGWAGRIVAVATLAVPLLAQAAGVRVTVLDYAIALILAWFLWSAATAAIIGARARARLPVLQARTLARRAVLVPADLPLAEAVRRAQEAGAGAVVTTDPAGAPSGLVNEAAVLAAPPERRPWMPVSAVSRTLGPGLALPADLAGEQLVRAMQAAPSSEYLLVTPDGAVFGVLSSRDVDAAFQAASTGRASGR